MRVTQGTFSFLPELTDEQIEAQIRYSVEKGWALSLEYTDDPHPRGPYWEMWNIPYFDLEPENAQVVMDEVRACREQFPQHYIKVIAYNPAYTKQTTALSFIVNRPSDEPGYSLTRTDGSDRVMHYTVHPYAADAPPGRRYGGASAGEADGDLRHPHVPE